HTVCHVLVVDRTGGVVVPANATDAAGDEVGVPRVLALHENGVAAEHRGRAVALGHSLGREINLGVDAQAADDPGDRIPHHLRELACGGAVPCCGACHRLDAFLQPVGDHQEGL